MLWNVGGANGIVESLSAADNVRTKNQSRDTNAQFGSYLEQALLKNYMGISSGYPYSNYMSANPLLNSLTGTYYGQYYGQQMSPYALLYSSLLAAGESSQWQDKIKGLLEGQTDSEKTGNVQGKADIQEQIELAEPVEGIKMRVINRYKQQVSPEKPKKQGVLV